MQRFKVNPIVLICFVFIALTPNFSAAWHDETHIAIAKAAGYDKWFNAAGADMAKIKAGEREAHNHYVNNPPGTFITPETVLAEAKEYNKIETRGHLYGAIVGSVRDYLKAKKEGKYREYNLAFCAHYVGDLSQPLHNVQYNFFNRKHHKALDGIINDEVLNNLRRIRIYSITIHSEESLAGEVARIANLSLKLGIRIETENRLLTKEETYIQIGHSASLLKGILGYIERMK